MTTLDRWTPRSMLVAVALLCTGGQAFAGPVDEVGRPLPASQATLRQTTLGSQLAAMSGTDLTLAVCRERMQALNSLLQEAGYGQTRTFTLPDGTLVARWYHPGRQMTALAFSGQNSTGNAFSVGEHAGLIRQGELIAIP